MRSKGGMVVSTSFHEDVNYYYHNGMVERFIFSALRPKDTSVMHHHVPRTWLNYISSGDLYYCYRPS